MFNNLSYIDFISILSFVIGLENLSENQQQSAHSEELIKQIDVNAANDRQAQQILSEIGKRLDAQDAMLKTILEVIQNENAAGKK